MTSATSSIVERMALFLAERQGMTVNDDDFHDRAQEALDVVVHHCPGGRPDERNEILLRRIAEDLCLRAGDSWISDDGAQGIWCSTALDAILAYQAAWDDGLFELFEWK